ncbi:hypothetical protein [Phenylobacterium immobile]|uniref:hypothetical protein n=1 Tax=Phenylobacterium immobile TaxID=21 RepID=UPI000AFBA4FE|nr:hypothetical protein [Phenylobacterium immobile]
MGLGRRAPDRSRRGAQASRTAKLRTLGDLIDLHIEDTKEVGRAPGRSKDAALSMLKRELGGRNIGTIKLVLSHAAAVHGVAVPVEPVDLARIALKRLGLVGKGNARNRGPTDDELARLVAHFDGNPRQIIPLGRFAVATAMFEAGFAIEQVALVAGHKDWKMLRRYTRLKPESLHALAASRAA